MESREGWKREVARSRPSRLPPKNRGRVWTACQDHQTGLGNGRPGTRHHSRSRHVEGNTPTICKHKYWLPRLVSTQLSKERGTSSVDVCQDRCAPRWQYDRKNQTKS